MFKIFQNLRRKLIFKRKSKDYFLYGIGEIFLIIIGILLALQINNWNESRKQSYLELKLLEEVSVSLEYDSVNLIQTIQSFNDRMDNVSTLKNRMSTDLPYHDSLAVIFARTSFMFGYRADYSAFESIKDAGLNIITNDSIRIKMLSYYYNLKHTENVNAEFDLANYFRLEIYPTYFKSFDWGVESTGAVPIDYEQLKKENKFQIALDYVFNDARFYLWNYNYVLEENKHLQNLVRNELVKRKGKLFL